MPKYKKKLEKMTARELELESLKLEIAEELGLGDKIRERGWQDLTAREAGRVGGRMWQRLSRKNLGTP